MMIISDRIEMKNKIAADLRNLIKNDLAYCLQGTWSKKCEIMKLLEEVAQKIDDFKIY